MTTRTRLALILLLSASAGYPALALERPVNASQRIDQRIGAKPIGRVQLLKAEKPEESKPAYPAIRRGQTEVRPEVSAGTSGIKKKRLISLDID